jgi:hypothetical protein
LFIVVCSGQRPQAIGVQFATTRIELEAIVSAQLGSERVDGDDKRSTISFELAEYNYTQCISQ